jgi:hypothetical protein
VLQQTRCRGFEEFQHRLEVKFRRIGVVNHHVGAGQLLSALLRQIVLTPTFGEAAITSWPP